MRFVQFFFFFLMLSFLNAEIFVEVQRVQVTKIETQAIGNYELVYYAYGNISRRLVYDNGKITRLVSLHNVFLGELQEVRHLEKIGWYFVGFPSDELYRHFKWGRVYNLNGKEYVPYSGVRKGYRYESNSYNDYSTNNFEEEPYDYEDNYANKNEYIEEEYSEEGYHEPILEEKYRAPVIENNYEEYDNGTADQWVDEGISTYQSPNHNNFPISNLAKELRDLIYLLSEEKSFAARVTIYAKTFPRITENQKGLASKIDNALEGLSPAIKVMFYGTATQYCIRKGVSRGFDYYLANLHKLTSDEMLRHDLKVYSEGSRYSGDWKNKKRNGYGVLLRPEGSKYSGQWHEGLKNGVGLHKWADGSFYVGDWKNNKRDGYGTLVLSGGEIYQQGWWRRGQFIGEVYHENENHYSQNDSYVEDDFVDEGF